jgi:hypothetical protein
MYVCKLENFVRGGNSKVQEETVATNFLGPMRQVPVNTARYSGVKLIMFFKIIN